MKNLSKMLALGLLCGFVGFSGDLKGAISNITGWYGDPNNKNARIDVTSALNAVYKKYGTIAVPGGYMNDLFGDPAPGIRKFCEVSFKEVDGMTKKVSLRIKKASEYEEIAYPSAVANKDEVAGVIRDTLKITNEIELIAAAGKNNLDRVKDLLGKGVDINTKLTLSRAAGTPLRLANAPLIQAAWTGALEVVRLLLERGADVNISESYGTQALHWAAKNGHVEIVKLLLAKGAKMDAQKSENPLKYALQSGNSAVIQELINIKDADGETPLMNAIQAHKLDEARTLLKSGADVSLTNDNGMNALHIAVLSDQSDIIGDLLKSNVNVNAVSVGWSLTPLHLAIIKNNLDAARVLLAAGANANAKAAGDTTPFHLAVELSDGAEAMSDLLLRNNADRYVKNANGQSAYDIVIAANRRSLVELLFETGRAAQGAGNVYRFDGTTARYADVVFSEPIALQASPKGNDIQKIERVSAAWYGFDGYPYNVWLTEKLQNQLVQNGGFFVIPSDTNAYVGVDPLPGQKKVIAVQVVIDGKAFDMRIPEGQKFAFPININDPRAQKALDTIEPQSVTQVTSTEGEYLG